MPKTLDDLRDHLFATLEDLRDKEKPMDIDRAKAISEVAQTVINTAKAEVDYARVLGRSDLVLPVFGEQRKQLPDNHTTPPAGSSGTVRTHRIK